MLLSINPEHVENILNGSKKFEYRKIRCSRDDVKKIVIYATSPIKLIVAEAEVKDIIIDGPDEVWNITSDFSGITKDFFDLYYQGKEIAVAYRLGKIKKFDNPKTLSDYGLNYAPQSFVYID